MKSADQLPRYPYYPAIKEDLDRFLLLWNLEELRRAYPSTKRNDLIKRLELRLKRLDRKIQKIKDGRKNL